MDETYSDNGPSGSFDFLKGLLDAGTSVYSTVTAADTARRAANNASAQRNLTATNWKPWLIGGGLVLAAVVVLSLFRSKG